MTFLSHTANSYPCLIPGHDRRQHQLNHGQQTIVNSTKQPSGGGGGPEHSSPAGQLLPQPPLVLQAPTQGACFLHPHQRGSGGMFPCPGALSPWLLPPTLILGNRKDVSGCELLETQLAGWKDKGMEKQNSLGSGLTLTLTGASWTLWRGWPQ